MKEEDPENGKHNKKLDEDNDPDSFAPVRHFSESFIIKKEYFLYFREAVFHISVSRLE
jgi:hypothetical protein